MNPRAPRALVTSSPRRLCAIPQGVFQGAGAAGTSGATSWGRSQGRDAHSEGNGGGWLYFAPGKRRVVDRRRETVFGGGDPTGSADLEVCLGRST